MKYLLIVLAAWSIVPATLAEARWAIRPKNVPTARLLENTAAHVKANPADPQGYYVLGRLHSMAFATDAEELTIGQSFRPQKTEDGLPTFLPYHSIKVQPAVKDGKLHLTGKRLVHLAASVRYYRRAINLSAPKPDDQADRKAAAKRWDPKDRARALLGLAWMYEVASGYLEEIKQANRDNVLGPLSPRDRKSVGTFFQGRDQWRDRAIATYQEAFEATKVGDQQRRRSGPGADSLISLDAAQSIVRMFKGVDATEDQQQLLTEMKAYAASMSNIGRVVTPIIFSLRETESVDELLEPNRIVKYDLDGDGVKSPWPWVRSDTWLLAWDPQRTRAIEDGRQLFGSVTWWIYWDDGYQPLAALDNNRDGWLEGAELMGISAWQDRNANGRSEKAEVVTLETLGIRRIATQPAARGAIATHPRGIEFHDGRKTATYDWTPRSK